LSNKFGGFYVPRYNSLIGVLASFHVACEMALKDLAPPVSTRGLLGDLSAVPSWEEGAEWREWIRQLTQIMKDIGLPYPVRKDAGSKSQSDKQSAFVHFVWGLQYCLPAGCARHMHSEAALADAIIEARKSGAKRPRATPQ
jgi:hypothetical protein